MATAPGFRPLHDAHAIEQVVASIAFDGPLADAAMRAATESMRLLEHELPGLAPINRIGISFGPQGIVPIAPEQTLGLARTASNRRGQVEEEFRMERTGITYRTQAYTRWDAVWGRLRGFLTVVLPHCAGVSLNAVALAYFDKFIWEGSAADCRPGALIRADSPYLAPSSFGATDLWHCHTGRFVRVDSAVKRLEAVDLDCGDEVLDPLAGQQKRVVKISTTLTDMFNQPSFDATNYPVEGSLGLIEEVMLALHNEQKAIFAMLVNDRAAALVGLNHAPASA